MAGAPAASLQGSLKHATTTGSWEPLSPRIAPKPAHMLAEASSTTKSKNAFLLHTRRTKNPVPLSAWIDRRSKNPYLFCIYAVSSLRSTTLLGSSLAAAPPSKAPPFHVLITGSSRVPKAEPTAAIIDGKLIAEKVREEVAAEITRMKSQTGGKVPGLAVVLVGSRKDSETYVRSKKKACKEVGIASFGEELPEDCSEEDVLNVVRKFNDDPSVHGILVQLPLPKHVNEEKVLAAVSIEKDVDGFHPLNMGKLAMQGRTPLFVPCTPRGCIELLLRSNIEIKGKHAVVIGRSNVVGTPAAMLLQRHQATVTVVHSYTPNPAEVTRKADIVIAAVGVAHLVRGDWIKPGAVVIDVGINPIDDPSSKKGYKLVGDVCFEEASTKASAITPVPGGVGPMTIAMLLCNTLDSAKRAYNLVD